MKGATLEQTASTPEARRLAEIAIDVDLATRSAPISGPDTIIRRPHWGKSMKPKSGKAHFESDIVNGHRPLPEGTEYVHFPFYYKHGKRHIEYWPAICYDIQGNEIGRLTE